MWKAEILRGRNMSFRKIEQTDLKGKGVTGLPDTPRLSTDAMQKKFDELAKDVIIPIYNEMIAQLEKDTAAADIGAKATEHFEEPTGKLQALLDVLAAVIYENQQARHTHENKLTLDEITENVKEGYDRLVTLLKGINSIDKVVTGSEDRIPTSKAIAEFVEELGGGDMVRAIYDTNRNGIVDDAEMLGGNAPEYYQPVHDEKLETNAKTIPEAINEVNAKELDVLDTMEEINANTDPGKPAGSLAVKELSRDIKGRIVWENLQPSSAFSAQTITLSESLSNYSYVEIIYKGVTSTNDIKTTGKLPIIEGLCPYLEYSADYSYRRQITEFSGTTITFADAMYYEKPSVSHATNNICIPYRVILYSY